MLTHIKNSQLSKRQIIYQKRKKACENFLNILWKEGFILGYCINCNNKTQLKIFLKYINNRPCINSLKFISKPERRIYYSIKQIWKIDSSKYFIIFSTNKGLKSIEDCKKLKLGGEPLLIIE